MLSLLRLIGLTLGELAYYLGIRRAVTEDNLAKAYPDKPSRFVKRVARRSFGNLGIVFAEMLYLRYASRRSIGEGLEIENLNEALAKIPRTTGIIFFGGHIGNWEWLAMSVGMQIDRSLNVVIKNQRAGAVDNFLLTMRTRFGNRMLSVSDVRSMFRALKSGETLGVLGDQNASEASIHVRFFGRDVPTAEGAARMALQTGATLVFMQPVERTDKGYRARFFAIGSSDLIGPTPENIRTLTERHTAALEQAIRENPEFWVWQHRRWKHAKESAIA
jgi:Kdo2-lipid IVA lauroyltransferase/acyltransferase